FPKALRYVEQEEADLIIQIPAGFERNLVREGTQKLGISMNAINGTKSSLGAAYLTSILNDYDRNIPLNVAGATVNSSPAPAIDVTYSNWFNPLGEYRFYIVPGVLVLLL